MSGAELLLLGLLAARLAEPDGAAAGAPTDALRRAIDTGDFETAVSAGELLVTREPGSSAANDLLGRAYGGRALESGPIAQIGLARKARAAFARAVELDPLNAAALADLATYDLRAPGFLGGSRSRARETAARVVTLDPARGHELLGEIAETDGKPEAAEAQYRLAMESAPPIRGRRALSEFFVRHRRYAEARGIWQGAGRPPPDDPLAAYELAGIALSSGERLDSYRAALEKSLQSRAELEDPRRAEILHRLALLSERAGRRAEAASLCEDALRDEPRRRAWRKDLDRLSR